MATGFGDLLMNMQALDFFSGVLPFVLVYAIFFVVLSNAPKFKESKTINALVSASFGLLAAFFVVSNPYYANFLINYLGFLTVGILGVVGVIAALLLTGFKEFFEDLGPGDSLNSLAVAVGGLAVAIVAVSFVAAGGLGPGTGAGGLTTLASFVSAAAAFLISTGLVWILLLALVVGAGLLANISDDSDDDS
jgi:hypothetical protein